MVIPEIAAPSSHRIISSVRAGPAAPTALNTSASTKRQQDVQVHGRTSSRILWRVRQLEDLSRGRRVEEV